MRFALLVLLVLSHPALIPTTARGDDQSARERKVKVALALSATAKPPAVAAPVDPNSCGKCREDFPAAWEDALKTRRPLAVFVGGPCEGLGQIACEAGAVAVKVSKYDQPGVPAGEKRIVIGRLNAGGTGFEVSATLPPKSDGPTVGEAVKAATPPDAKPTHLPPVPKVAPVKLDWLVK